LISSSLISFVRSKTPPPRGEDAGSAEKRREPELGTGGFAAVVVGIIVPHRTLPALFIDGSGGIAGSAMRVSCATGGATGGAAGGGALYAVTCGRGFGGGGGGGPAPRPLSTAALTTSPMSTSFWGALNAADEPTVPTLPPHEPVTA